MRPMRRLALVVALTLTGGIASVSPASAAGSGAFGTGTPDFTVTAADSSLLGADNAGEPSIGIDWKTGSGLFMAGTATLKLGFNPTTGVAQWSDASPELGLTPNLDPILATDPISGTTLAGGDTGSCSVMYRSTDDGSSWSPTLPCPGTTDHPSVGWAPSALNPGTRVWYYCQQQGLQFCATSTDDGVTFTPGSMDFLDCESFHGHIRGSADGTTYLPGRTCFDADGNIKVGGLRTTDDGATWTPYTIPTAPEPASGFDPAVATTPDNALYEAWNNAGDYHPVVARSNDHGTTWGTTVDLAGSVNPPIVASTFPTLVAGDNGRVAYSYLATQVGSGTNPFATGFHGVWNLFTSYTYDGGATWTTIKDTATPVQYGEIDAGGTTTQGQRNLLDFMDSSLTKDGRVVVAFADGCLSDCESAGSQAASEALSTHATASVAYQRVGKGLFAAYDDVPVAPSPTGTVCPGGRAGFVDDAGDATEAVVTGTTPLPNDPSLDLLDGSVSWDQPTTTAILRAHVADLTKAPLVGDGYYRWSLKLGADTTTYTLSATVPANGTAATFDLYDNSTGSTVVTQTLSGSVDKANGIVEIRLPSALYQAAKNGNPPLTGTTAASVAGVLGQRNVGIATLTADTAKTLCNGTLAPPITPPAAPVLTGTATGSTVNLSWNAPADGGAPITSYQVLRGTSAGSLTQLATTAGTSYADSTGTPGTTYFYAVTATNSAGVGPASNTVSCTPVTTPGASSVTATPGVGSASLSWSVPTDGGSPITGYVVERGTASGVRSTLTTLAAGTTSYTDSAAAAGTTYYYAVHATNAVGDGPSSTEATATPYALAGAPTLLAVAGRGQVSLSWSTPSDGGRPIQGYRIYRGTAAGGEVLVQTISSGTSYIDGGLTRGTKYWYRVAAFTSAGDGAQSNEVSSTPK